MLLCFFLHPFITHMKETNVEQFGCFFPGSVRRSRGLEWNRYDFLAQNTWRKLCVVPKTLDPSTKICHLCHYFVILELQIVQHAQMSSRTLSLSCVGGYVFGKCSDGFRDLQEWSWGYDTVVLILYLLLARTFLDISHKKSWNYHSSGFLKSG